MEVVTKSDYESLLPTEGPAHSRCRGRRTLSVVVAATLGIAMVVGALAFLPSSSSNPTSVHSDTSMLIAADGSCSLQCYHGGKPDDKCETCVGCAGAWTGKQCTEWDESVSQETLMAEIAQLVEESKSDLDKLQELHPVPGTIGMGVDITTGEVKLPVVQLTYKPDTAAQTWTNSKGVTYIVPDEAQFTDYQSTGLYNPTRDTYVFQNEAAFGKHLSQCLTAPCGGAMSMMEFMNNAKNQGGSLTTSQQFYPVYNMELPVDPETKRRVFSLHRSAKRAVEALPPHYDTDVNKAVFQEFIKNWGTSYTTSSENGGVLEHNTYVEYALWTPFTSTKTPFSEEEVKADAAVAFSALLKESTKVPNADFTNAIKGHAIRFRGGAADTASVDGIELWVDTIEESPVPVKFAAAAIPDLITELDMRSGLQQAIHEHVREQMKRRIQSPCPAKWGGDHCQTPLCDGLPAGVGCILGVCNADSKNKFTHTCVRKCQWQCGEPGQFMQCPSTTPKSLVQGQCGGGMSHDCTAKCTGNGAIECCQGEAPLQVAAAPKWKCSRKGQFAFCNADEGSVIGECESGKENDCGAFRHRGDGTPCAGGDYHSAILCGGITNVDMDKCQWNCHFKGTFAECPEGTVLMGKCGGGAEHDCMNGPCAGKDTYHATYCCPIKAP